MRHAITTGIRHGHQTPEVITGPNVPLAEQREEFLKLRGGSEHPDFHKIELWTSDAGIVRKARFSKPVSEEELAQNKAAADQAAEKAAKKAAKEAKAAADQTAKKTGKKAE